MTSSPKRYSEFYRSSGYAAFPRQERSGGRLRTEAMVVHQEPHENMDPATSDVVVGLTLAGATPARWKVGPTWREIEARRPGCIGVSPLDEPLEMSVPEDHSLLVIAISRSAVAELQAGYMLECAEILNEGHWCYHYDQETERRAHAVWRALSPKDSIASLLVDAEVQGFLASILRMIAGRDLKRRRLHSSIDLGRLEEYIRAAISDGVSVKSLADLAGLKPSYFNETFKRQTGETPYNFVRKIRAQMAIDLLLAGKEPLAVIAYRLGFADQAHFARELKAQTGFSPSDYRS